MIMKNEPLENVLAAYEGLTDRLSDLLKREQGNLPQGVPLEATIEEKRLLLDELSALNERLKVVGLDRTPLSAGARAQIETVQNRLMSVLKHDRSVEKSYLSLFVRSAGPPSMSPAPGQVAQTYQRQNNRS